MHRIPSLILSIVVWAMLGLPASASELAERAAIDLDVDQMLQQADFAALEAMSVQFRDTNARTSSGLQKLNLFYFALGDSTQTSLRHLIGVESLIKRADSWIAAYPNSPAAAINKAIVHSQHGWHIRGGGFASSVRPAAWEPFRQAIKKADDVLLQTKDYAAIDPFWYTHRLNVLTHLGTEPEVFLPFATEALDRHPTFYQLYFSIANYLAPKWQGNAYYIEAFANQAVERTKAIDGNGLYARIYWYASQTQYDLDLFTKSDVVWANMREGIVDVMAQYPDQWNLQNFALFSCLAEDAEMTRHLFAKMEGRAIMEVWRNRDFLVYCRDFAESGKI